MTVYGVDRDGPGISSSANIPPLLSDGTQALTADWDAGPYEIRALTFESDVATGTAPFTIASTTMVTNLNADMVDGYHAASFLLVADIDDVPVNGATTVPISSNWAYDHVADADPHTGYRLESADHTHQSTGAQGGQLDHGLALTGLTDDDHTQYVLLIGRATGQIIIGGTGASEALALRSTSHGTLGVVALADTGGDVTIGGAATASAIRFLEPSGSGSNYTAFKAQAQAASVTYTLPAADATVSGYALKSDAAGALSWGPAGGVESKQSITQNTHGFAVGDVLYHNGTIFALADASASATAEVVGIVQAVTDVNTFTLLYGGYIDTLSGLTAGSVYFLSETAGDLTATEPSTVGTISKPLLIASSTTAGYFFNMRGSVVGTASSTLSVENFSGDGSDTTFTLASSPLENNTFVMVEGVYQQKNTYSISGTTLTFSTAPPSGTNNIEVVTVGSVNIGTPSDATVTAPKLSANVAARGNFTLAASVAANALTVAIKTLAGADPSASDPVYLYFPDGSGGETRVAVTAASSLVVSSGSTLGTVSAAPSRIWVVGFNDAGTFRLGVINCHSASYTADGLAHITNLNPFIAESSTAEGGAGAADSGQTFYTGTAVTSKYYVVLGYIESTQTTAGTWAQALTTMAYRDGMPLPGDVIQRRCNTTLGGRSAADTSAADTTNSGVAITAKSLANLMRVAVSGYSSFSLVGGTNVDSHSILARGTTSLRDFILSVGSGAGGLQMSSAIAHDVMCVPSSGSNTYIHRQYVSSASSTLTTSSVQTTVEEIMG